MTNKDLKLQLHLGVKDQGTKQSLDNVISLLKKLEQAGKESGQGTAVGAKQAAEAIRLLKLETQQHKSSTEAGKKEQIELKNALMKAKLAAQEERLEFQKLKNQLNDTNKSAESLKKTFGLLGTVISVGLIVKTFKDISSAAIEAAESENLFTVSLGHNVNAARKWSEELSKSLGLNAYELRKNLGVFTVMLNSMGLTEDQAYKMSKSITKLAYDLASFYNLSHEEAFNKIKAGITGETEPLKALGIILNETTVKQAAYAHGITQQGKELNEVQKIQARYIALMEQTSKAQGDLERTSDSASNMIKRSESTIKDLYVTTGNLLIPTIQDLIKIFLEFVSTLKDFVVNNGVKIQTTFEAIAKTIKNSIDTIVSAINSLNNLTFGGFETAFNGVLSALNTASYIAAKLAKEIELLTAISKQSQDVPTENELYQKKLVQLGINPKNIPFEAQINPNHPMYAKLKQAYAMAKSEHIQLKYGDQNQYTKEIQRLKNDIAELEKTWLETQKKLLIKPYQLSEELKKQNDKLKQKLQDTNIGDGMIHPTTGTITSGFGKRKDPFTGELKDHTGVDIANKIGTKIQAAATGKIIHAGKLGGYGNAIIIEHGDGLQTLYGHLNKILVKDKQQVFQGDVIAEMGSTGRSTGSHLHFEVKEKGTSVNPSTYISSLTPGKKEFLEEGSASSQKATIDKNLEAAVYRLERMKELLAKAESLGLSEASLQFGSQKLNVDRLKAIGLSDQDIELIQSQAAKMYEGLMKADENYQQFKEKQLEKASAYLEDYTKQLAEAQINYELKLKEIENSEKPEELKTIDKTNLNRVYEDTVNRLKTEYAVKINQLNKEILEEDIKYSEKRIEIVEEEVKKQLELRVEAQQKTKELHEATNRIYQDSINQRALFEAQYSENRIAIVNAEAKIKADAIQREIEAEKQTTKTKLAEINKKIKAEKTLSSTITELEKEKQALIQNSLAKLESLREEAHQNELERIKKETEAYAEQFEKKLSFLSKIFNLSSKIFGNNNILSKISEFINSYGSTITEILKYLGVFNQALQNQQTKNPFSLIQNFNISNLLPTTSPSNLLSTPTQQNINSSLAPFIKGTYENLSQQGIVTLNNLYKLTNTNTNNISKLGSVLGSIIKFAGGALTGAITGYTMGHQSGPLGILGGAASGALTGFSFGGPIGAAIGAGVGLISGLFGWLFGRRTKKELKRLQKNIDAFNASYNTVSSYVPGVGQNVSNAAYLDEMTAAETDIANLKSMAASAAASAEQLNPNNFKKKKAKKAAAKAYEEAINAVNETNQQIAQMEAALQEKIKQRKELIKQTTQSMKFEYATLQVENKLDPYRFNADSFAISVAQSEQKRLQTYKDFRDAPDILYLAEKIRAEEQKALEHQKYLDTLTSVQAYNQLKSEAKITGLMASGASQAEILKAEKEQALMDLEIEMLALKENAKDNQEALTLITEIEANKRLIIEKETQEQIQALYKQTGQSIMDLIKARMNAENMFDFTREKTRTQIKLDQIAEIDKAITELVKGANINDLMNGLTPEDQAKLQAFISANPGLFAGMSTTELSAPLLDASGNVIPINGTSIMQSVIDQVNAALAVASGLDINELLKEPEVAAPAAASTQVAQPAVNTGAIATYFKYQSGQTLTEAEWNELKKAGYVLSGATYQQYLQGKGISSGFGLTAGQMNSLNGLTIRSAGTSINYNVTVNATGGDSQEVATSVVTQLNQIFENQARFVNA